MNLILQAASQYVPIYDRVYAPQSESTPWNFFDYIAIAVGIFLFLWFISIIIRPDKALKSWHHHFAGLSLSAQSLYEQIIAEIKSRQMPDVTFGYGKFFEAGIFSARRGYLCIDYKKFDIDVCCVQFGTGFYISWWLGQKDPGLFSRIPILRDLLGLNPEHQSYYQLDTATLFQSAVHDSILKAIDEVSKDKGIRLLTEFERQPGMGLLPHFFPGS